MKTKRILFVAPLPPPVHGSAMMSQYIKDSKLINESFRCDYVNLSTSRRMNEIGKFSIAKIFRFLSSYVIVFWQLLTHRYDVCYLAITCYGIGFLKDMPFVWLAKLLARKVVIHQHNKGMAAYVHRKPYKWLLPLTYRNTRVILLSWHLYKDISEVVSKDQILICPNGIPPIRESVHEERGEKHLPHLLFLSNLNSSKGVYVLLDACQRLKERGIRFVCDFVGGETKEISRVDFENEIAVRKLNDVCVYHGPQYGEDKLRFFEQASVFVQPTFNDCFPLTLVEAMQHALPVVSSVEGGIPDIIEDGQTGFLCKSKDVQALTDALGTLLLDKDLRIQQGNNGYRRYHSMFTVSVFEENMAKILRAL